MEKLFVVYMLASRARGVLYIGVTSDIVQRVHAHREKATPGFTSRYFVNRLVWYETHPGADSALARERALKRWRRDWKIHLIETTNSTWQDLYPRLLADFGIEPF